MLGSSSQHARYCASKKQMPHGCKANLKVLTNNMKTILFLSIFFWAIALPALGDLTDTDLNRIRLIIDEEIEAEIEPIKAEIVTLKTDVAWIRGKLEGIDKQFAAIDTQFAAIDKQFERVSDQIRHVTYITYGLIALIVAAVAIPQILIAWRSGKDRSLEKLYSLERLVETLVQEVETLKQKQPSVPENPPPILDEN